MADIPSIKRQAISGRRYGIGLRSNGLPEPEWPSHPRSCECKGRGYIHVSDGSRCNCGSGEGCGVHNESWMPVILCTEDWTDPATLPPDAHAPGVSGDYREEQDNG